MSARRRAAALPLLLAMALGAGADSDPRKAQQIVFPEIPEHAVGDAPFNLAAKASSGLPLTFSVVAGPADLNGSLVKLAGRPGLVIVRASQAGDGRFQPATDAERAFTVTARPAAPRIVSQPSPRSSSIGDPIILEVSATGEPAPSYEWRRDGAGVAQGNGARLVIPSASLSDEGSYRVTVTNRMGSATSAEVRVDVHKRSQVINFTGPSSIPAGRPVNLSATASSGLPLRFEVVSGPATLFGATITAGAGFVTIRATQPGDSTYEPATAVQSFAVNSVPGGLP